MQDFVDSIKGKKITVMGLGLLGRGVGDVRFLAEHGAYVTVTDKKTKEELAVSLESLKDVPHTSFHLGEHNESDFVQADMVLVAPATPLDSPFVRKAILAGVHVSMSTALATTYAHSIGVTTVGITGTRGKSTVTYMMHHVLTHYTGKRVHLGGNIRGVSTLALIPQLQKGDILLMELDSWQLQGFGYESISPHVAVFTSFSPDHQNYYPNEERYFADKARIFAHQKKGDSLIVHESIAQKVQAYNPPVPITISGAYDSRWTLRIPGEHNRHNASLAQLALRALGVSDDVVKEGLMSFLGVEGRLEYMGEKDGVHIYNDNNATTPTATLAALRACAGKRIILIAGGSDKGLPLSGLAEYINAHVPDVFLLVGTGTSKLAPLLKEVQGEHDNLETAVRGAYAVARPGDVLLFSPAFASFGYFKNEYERNDAFKAIIASL